MGALADRQGADIERIFHVSETSGIIRFHPRADAQGRERVWAIGESRLHNYLLPRDCPRVTYYSTASTTVADREVFFSVADCQSVVAIERGWLAALQLTRLHVYEFATGEFVLEDAIAGYYVSPHAVSPISHREVAEPLSELINGAVELRVLSTLWPLHDTVVASSLAFSIIRMRNALPRNASPTTA